MFVKFGRLLNELVLRVVRPLEHHASSKLLKRLNHGFFGLMCVHAIGDFLLEAVGNGFELIAKKWIAAQLLQQFALFRAGLK